MAKLGSLILGSSAVLSSGLRSAGELSVLVVGDSFGDTGPTYRALDDTFTKHGVSATTKSTAVGGTTACQWAAQEDGMKLVNDAKKQFPEAVDGPDFMWYTLGGNDPLNNDDFQTCLKSAKAGTYEDALKCAPAEVQRVVGCGATLLENYWVAFPKTKVLFTGYDVPCYSDICQLSFIYFGNYCGSNITCENQLSSDFQSLYSTAMKKRFAGKPFTAVNFMGAAQKAAGVAGADVGKPVMNQGAKYDFTSLCVHPKYGTPAGDVWTDAFWDFYFQKEVGSMG
eukprot:TRINITY_DN38428_c0_g1_i1.p1 TRINITY_DN38428_c0_g1~~TRINITY_DN38428_c0_g1_i1.p1  ORF type:complete len:308 (-),score=57.13 TRINITY_DN38428_c0_g1_i1:342-1187(-)